MSDSGSSTTSGHWSGSSGVSTPSPPHPQASPKYLGDAFGSPQTDNGFETDPDAFLLDEPAPRKRKVRGVSGELSRGRAPGPGPSQAPSRFSFSLLLLFPPGIPRSLHLLSNATSLAFSPLPQPCLRSCSPAEASGRPSFLPANPPHPRRRCRPPGPAAESRLCAPACQCLWSLGNPFLGLLLGPVRRQLKPPLGEAGRGLKGRTRPPYHVFLSPRTR